MRQIISLFMLFLCINMASAQSEEKKHAFYVTGDLNLGNYFGGDLNLNYVLKEKYTFKIGYTANMRTAKSRPEDFQGSAFSALSILPLYDLEVPFSTLFLLAGTGPYDHIENYRFDVGRIYKLNKRGTVRINAAVGLGYATVTEPVNWKKEKGNWVNNPLLLPLIFFSGLFYENYSWDYKEKSSISLIINPKIEFAFTRIGGLTISPMVQVNRYRTYFGIGMGMMLGVLR